MYFLSKSGLHVKYIWNTATEVLYFLQMGQVNITLQFIALNFLILLQSVYNIIFSMNNVFLPKDGYGFLLSGLQVKYKSEFL